MQILTALSSEPLARIYRNLFHQNGYGNVTSVGTADEALTMVRAGGIDLILIGETAPSASPLMLLQQLRAVPEGVHIPCIVLTARDQVSRESVILKELPPAMPVLTPTSADMLKQVTDNVLRMAR